MLTDWEINHFKILCEWLENQPDKSAYSSAIAASLPRLQHLVSDKYKPKRTGLVYYQVGYGWRLNKRWRQKMNQLEAEIKNLPVDHMEG